MATEYSTLSSLSYQDRQTIWHPFTQMKTAEFSIPIVRGKGIYLYSEDGSRYIDAVSSWWVNLHGHAHPYIIEKIKEQAEVLEHVIFADFTHSPAVNLATRLLPLLPGEMSKIFFSDNGSTSVEVAIKIALQYWHNQKIEKAKIVCFKNSYHGDTFGAMSCSGRNHFNRPFWTYLFEVELIDPPLKGQEEKSLIELQKIINSSSVACFIFEPLVLGAGGMIIYPAHGLDALLKCCHMNNIITIADEVMTGFGRTGTLFACDQLHEKPDIICLSKGLTGGFLPLGVTACKENIYEAFLGNTLSQAFLHGHSYTANPLACTSALASLDLLLDDSCVHQRKMIAQCHEEFCKKFKSHPKLRRCESLGTILAIEYQSDNPSYFSDLRDRLYKSFLAQGIYVRPLGNVINILPPYCIQESELNIIYNHIIKTLEEDL